MKQSHNDRIVFLSVPESLRGQIESLSHGDFSIDPAIPIPVELAPGETSLNLEELSWEMILSGMIRVIAEEIGAEDAAYYRAFVIAVKPDILNEFTEAAILKARNGDYDLALEILDALGGLFPQSPEVLLNRAVILENRADALERSGREEEAEAANTPAHEAYKEALSLNPPFPGAFFNAGFFYMNRRNFEKARDCFSQYLALAEEAAEHALPFEPEKTARAQAIIKEIESRSLDDTMFREAYDFIRLGQEEKGLLTIRNFLERHPDVWNGWFLLGWGLRKLGRWEDGAAAFYKTLELGGDNSDTRNELAICLMEQGKYRDARKELEICLREEPENVKIISNFGVLAMKQGCDDEAAAFFRTVLELDPDDPVAKEYLQGGV